MPASCANRVDQWQALGAKERFEEMDRELAAAEEIGFNTMRLAVELQGFGVWLAEHDSFMENFERSLALLDKHKMRAIVLLGNDCMRPKRIWQLPRPGPQPCDLGYHGGRKMSQYGSFPGEIGHSQVDDPVLKPKFYAMCEELMTRYRTDGRILFWNLWNEPGNSGRGQVSVEPIREMFRLAWRIDPVQPLAADVWQGAYGTTADDRNHAQRVAGELSDIVSYHCYDSFEEHVKVIAKLKRHFRRPLINTEWLARTIHCDVFDNYPLFYLERIGAVNWGLVNGRYQTHEPWEFQWHEIERDPRRASEIDMTKWLHDLLRPSLRPYDPREINLMRRFNKLADRDFSLVSTAVRPQTPLQGTLPVSWRLVGPGGGGAFKSLAASRWDRNRIFAGSDVGGFYVSDDRGRSWRMANTGLEDPYVETIAEHPMDAKTLFIGTRGGVYVTHDLGKTWRPCRKGFPPRNLWAFSVTVRKIAFAPDDPETVYALIGPPGDRAEKKGLVYVSHDGGSQWEPLVRNAALPSDVKLVDFSVHGRKPGEMLVVSTGGLFLSTDGGASWRASNAGLPAHLRTVRVARAPSDPDVVYVTLRQKCGEAPWNAGVYRSADGGRTWSPRCNGLRQSSGPADGSDMNSTWVCEIVVDPRNPNIVYAGGKAWADPDMYKTVDGGLSWRKKDHAVKEGWIGFWGRAVDCLAISSADPNLLLFGTAGGVYVSEDAGESWTQRYAQVFEDGRFAGTGLDDTCLHGITPDPTRPGRFYLGYFDIGLLVTEDNGRSFRRCVSGIPSQWENSCFAVVQAPDDPDRLWASFGAWTANGVGGIVATSHDGGRRWQPVTGQGTGFRGFDPRGLACFGVKPDYRLVHLSPDGVVTSEDGGRSWQVTSGLFDGERPTKLLVRDGEALYCVTERKCRSSVWRSVDKGASWTRIASPRDGIGEVYGLSAQGDDIVVSARDTRETLGGVWCSSDGGKTFRRAVTDRFCSGALVTGGYYLASLTDHPFHDEAFGGGIIASPDKGKTWWSLNTESLQNLTVTSLQADPSDTLVVWAGTGGGSVFVGRLPPLKVSGEPKACGSGVRCRKENE